MNYRALGNTGLMVSEIGMGCEGFNENDYRMTGPLFDLAEKYGVNYFDLYASDPQLRAAVGDALQGRREKFIIQSHICSVWKNGQYLRTRDLAETKAGFEEMMSLLKTDRIDVGMIHYCDALSDWQKILDNGILDYARELKKEGRIRHIGLSSHNPQVAIKAVESGAIEVLMFSVNPCYDLQPANEDVEQLWADEAYASELTNMDPERLRGAGRRHHCHEMLRRRRPSGCGALSRRRGAHREPVHPLCPDPPRRFRGPCGCPLCGAAPSEPRL